MNDFSTNKAEARREAEQSDTRSHEPERLSRQADPLSVGRGVSGGMADPMTLQALARPDATTVALGGSLEELLVRDAKREQDGFPRKIRIGRVVKPGKGSPDKVVVVPTTVEEKLIHDRIRPPDEGGEAGGTGEGEEGEVIGEQPVQPQPGAGQGQAGQGGGESHELESSAYELGKILTEKFNLPNLKDKGKKSAIVRYTYDLTDRNRGVGQILDKKATLRRVLATNIAIGTITDPADIDPGALLIAPRDKVYRTLSREREYESEALVFFLRDYSGSMEGKATEIIASQHVMIYSWLMYQYGNQVTTRFILHDTEAREVPDFTTYYSLQVAGGTRVAAAYRLVNELVEQEGLARNYNIYIFHGTDGDDFDSQGEETVPEISRMLTYANRVGITVAEHDYGSTHKTEVERYVTGSGLLDKHPDLFRLDVMGEDAEEQRLIDGIKKLIS